MGSSRDIAIGPVAVVSLLLGTLLQEEIDSATNPKDYLRLAFTATFFAGITQATLGILRWFRTFFIHSLVSYVLICSYEIVRSSSTSSSVNLNSGNRLGFLIDFLSHAAIVGFMGGAAITIALQQLKGFLGIKKFTKKTDIISVMQSVFGSMRHGVSSADCKMKIYQLQLIWVPFSLNTLYTLSQWNWQTIVIATTFLGFLLFAKYMVKFLTSITNNIRKNSSISLLPLFL